MISELSETKGTCKAKQAESTMLWTRLRCPVTV